MRKHTSRLRLDKQTLRHLASVDLARANAGVILPDQPPSDPGEPGTHASVRICPTLVSCTQCTCRPAC